MLSAEQARAFLAHGSVVVPQLVGPDLRGAALAEINRLVADTPPEAGKVGPHFYFLPPPAPGSPFDALLNASGLAALVERLIAPHELETPDHVQVSLILPGWDHRPGGPHLDGLSPLEPHDRPGTFTLLAGIMLTDQPAPGHGNLWVWPGSHEVAADYLRRHGPDALRAQAHPTWPMAPPEPVLGRAGDVLLAQYLLGHNMGGNTSPETRRTVYFRLQATGHRQRWREAVQDPWLELAPVRALAD